jgi:hypothetical protein
VLMNDSDIRILEVWVYVSVLEVQRLQGAVRKEAGLGMEAERDRHPARIT